MLLFKALYFILVITDFENVMVEAAQNVFQEAHVSGCYFRFSQELFRKWTEFNLGDIYGNEDSQAGNIARMTFRFFFYFFILGLLPVWRGTFGKI